MTDPSEAGLKGRLHAILVEQARMGALITYKQAADQLGLMPPLTIQRVAQTLETLLAEDAAAGRPLLAAICVSRVQSGLPRRGFFETARQLGLFKGDPDGGDAAQFHAEQLDRVWKHYNPA